MELNEYQRKALATRNPDTDLLYTSGKLTTEAAELQQHVLKNRYHGKPMPPEIIEELGDVLWYAAAVAHDLGVTLDQVAKRNLEMLELRHGDKFRAAFYVDA